MWSERRVTSRMFLESILTRNTAPGGGSSPKMLLMTSELRATIPALAGQALRRGIRITLARFIDLARYDVFLFGSEVGRSGSSRSDIDIGLQGPEPLPGPTLQRIREELERLRTLRTFDLVDFSRVDEAFKSVALQHVEKLLAQRRSTERLPCCPTSVAQFPGSGPPWPNARTNSIASSGQGSNFVQPFELPISIMGHANSGSGYQFRARQHLRRRCG